MLNDFRFALRLLLKNPVFALTAVATIALGIAAATTIFSVTDAVLLRPLPYREPGRLVIARSDMVKRNVRDFPLSNPDFLDFKRETTQSFEDVGAVLTGRQAFPLPDGSAEQLRTAGVTTNFFALLGGKIVAGRDFNESDGDPGAPRVAGAPPPVLNAVLSYEYWQRRFGGSKEIFGRPLADFGNQGPVVVGVVAPGFELLFPASADMERKPDLWIALRLRYDNAARNQVSLRAIARLRAGVNIEQAQAQSDIVSAEIRQNFQIQRTSGFALVIEPMHRHLVDEVRPALLALMGAVLFLLLIACANVANLLLVRASLREREYAVRTALGGGWWRLAKQTLAEVLTLSAAGTVAGVFLGSIAIDRLLDFAPANLPRLDAVRLSPAVLAFAAILGLIAALIFGIAPLFRMARPDVLLVLRTSGRAPGLGGGNLLRSAVVVVEVALCFVLLVGCGLMFRSFLALQRVDPGFKSDGLLTLSLELSGLQDRRTPESRREFQSQLKRAFADLPGVTQAAATFPMPLGGGFSPIRWGTEEALTDPTKFQAVNPAFVLPGYLETMQIRLIAGRTFTEQDNVADRMYVIVDHALAAKAFGHEPAVGKRILVRVRTPTPEWVEIIGVVGHIHATSLTEPGREQIYFTDGFTGHGNASEWALRTSGNPAALVSAARAALAKVDSRIIMVEARPMSVLVSLAQAATRFQLTLIATFAVLAALLAAVGLYGVLSTIVRQRTAEIGVRMALGAAPVNVFRLVVGHGMRLSALGVLLGGLAGLALTRMMSSMLVEVQPADPATYAVMASGFLLVAAMAAWIPARRAAALDPMIALREG